MTARFLLAVVLLISPAFATPAQQFTHKTYGLQKGSTLTDDCPVCDRLAIVVPISGTFELLPAGEDPLFTYFLVQDLKFRTSDPALPQYTVVGSASYQFGGEVALLQKMSLSLEIAASSGMTSALCHSETVPALQPWPTIKISVLQTNGTSLQVYTLDLIAAPLPYFTSIRVDALNGDVELHWEAVGTNYQVERASSPTGPFEPVSGLIAATTFIDPKAAATNSHVFYRLQQL